MDTLTDGWFDITQWEDCRRMERPGYVFEIENAAGMTIQTNCVAIIEVPFDWTSPPLRFRLIPEVVPRHSDPIPLPVTPQ